MIRTGTTITVAATLVIWAVVLLAGLVAGFGAGIISFALVGAIGSTVALWLVWAFMSLDALSKTAQSEKSKRSAPEDDVRLSLLLQMLDDDERQTIKRRLRDELGTDGEAIGLDDLLKDRRARR